MLVLLLLMLQDKQLSFQPVQSGMPVQLSTFNITVPEGLLYAAGADAEYMMPLCGATNIPNCHGIFFSRAEDWSFCGVVVFLPFQNFAFDSVLPADIFVKNFEKTHLYYISPVTAPATNIVEPNFDPDEQSFVFGMEYKDPGKEGIFVKKVWLNAQDTLVMVVKVSSHESYLKNLPAIDAMLASVTQSTEVESLPTQPASFLQLYGLTPGRSEAPSEGMPLSIIIGSVLLGITGIGLMIFAIRLQRKTNSGANPDDMANAHAAEAQNNEIAPSSE